MAWHTVSVPDAPPKLATDLVDLGPGLYDGHVGIVRIGTWPDMHEEQFVWSAEATPEPMWIGAREYVVLSALDAWAMDFARQPMSLLRNKWARPNGGVGWQVVGQRGYADEAVTLPDTDIHVISAPGEAAWPSAGQFLLRDVLITYTGFTLDGAGPNGTFTGCSNNSAFNGRTFDAGHTPIIPYGAEAAGDHGGWGTSVVQLDRVGELWAAGFRLEERLDGFFNGTTDLTSVDFAPFYLNTDANENLGAASNYPALSKSADTVPNLLGPGVTVTSPAYDMGGYTQPGTHLPYDERGFERRTSAWMPWAAAAPTKRFLTPLLYAKHATAAKNNGECYSVNLMMRWTGTP